MKVLQKEKPMVGVNRTQIVMCAVQITGIIYSHGHTLL